MANVYGYKSKLIAITEPTYGNLNTVWTGNSYAHNDTTIDMVDNSELIERMVRSGVLGESTCETTDGRVGGQVTISGVFSKEKHWMIVATALKNTGASVVDFSVQASDYSRTLVRDFGNGYIDIAYGCVVSSMEFSNDDNFINYSITFDAQEVKFGQAKATVFDLMTGDEPDVACETPFKTKDFELTSDMANLTPLTFSLTITNEFDEDKVNYGISNKKQRVVVSKTTGEFTVEGLIVSGSQSLEDIGTEIANTLTITDGSQEEIFIFNSKISSRAIPDVERGAYVCSYTSRIVKLASSSWLTIELA
jgi:hypothetical protein